MTKDNLNYCYGGFNIFIPSLNSRKDSVQQGTRDLPSSRMHLFDDYRQKIQKYLETYLEYEI
jgi:hypothetical protein